VAVQIYVGVLVKYVNFGKGWRHRLFVLKGGVLRYYKVVLVNISYWSLKIGTFSIEKKRWLVATEHCIYVSHLP
jgi:hypothetical protein